MNEQRTNETQAKGGSSPERALQIIGGSDDLNLYVLGVDGISRTKLNVMYLVGVFLFGWLITLVWKAFGREAQGWTIIVIMAVCTALWQLNGNTDMVALAVIAYAGSWVHANLVLTKYQRLARSRIQEIDSVENPSTDLLLVKGILQGKVLCQIDAATSLFSRLLQADGGHPQLLNLAGVQLCAYGRYEEAKDFFNRAIVSDDDQSALTVFKANLALAEGQTKRK